jgi:hypothetical protein
MKTLTGTLVLGLVLLLAGLAGVAHAGKGKLDGKTYKVTITEPNKNTYVDTFVFKDGTFDSTGCQKFGFKPGGYAGDGTSFTAMTQSDKEGKIDWTGTVKGDAIEGKFVWTKAGQPVYTYTFVGTIQK